MLFTEQNKKWNKKKNNKLTVIIVIANINSKYKEHYLHC